ncbi:Cholesterol side-chain cleavage enzyme, mitochondrial [Gossypium arboreum]|uniref:Cholesterol side-chain cleavage enzyme, mitochondrial n=1 Tax=Gossypium arboreum TaxID=29729 RepID=A0A0B0NBT1_GOSAR|nr:Cholesterol side-chain cleavage enzyme, mitochondrial [Gossypium arboreum]
MTHEQYPDLTIEGSTRGKSGTMQRVEKATFRGVVTEVARAVVGMCGGDNHCPRSVPLQLQGDKICNLQPTPLLLREIGWWLRSVPLLVRETRFAVFDLFHCNFRETRSAIFSLLPYCLGG